MYYQSKDKNFEFGQKVLILSYWQMAKIKTELDTLLIFLHSFFHSFISVSVKSAKKVIDAHEAPGTFSKDSEGS